VLSSSPSNQKSKRHSGIVSLREEVAERRSLRISSFGGEAADPLEAWRTLRGEWLFREGGFINSIMNLWQHALIFIATLAAGMVNSVAGGGTLISFPTLVWLGRDPIFANATNAVALWPGSFAGMIGFRRELKGIRHWILRLTAPSLLGGVTGAMLLLHTSAHTFSKLIPYLIFLATLIMAGQEMIARRLYGKATAVRKKSWWVGAIFFQFLVGVYGGYFGAGMGILILAALGLLGLTDIHQMNGLKNFLTFSINGIASVYFVASGAVLWTDALLMMAAAVIGGFTGAGVARRVGRTRVRYFVVLVGLGMTISMLILRH